MKLPTEHDGAPAVYVRLDSHRARERFSDLVPDLEAWCSMRNGHVYAMRADRVADALAAMPAYCRGSVRVLKRIPPGDTWGHPWSFA